MRHFTSAARVLGQSRLCLVEKDNPRRREDLPQITAGYLGNAAAAPAAEAAANPEAGRFCALAETTACGIQGGVMLSLARLARYRLPVGVRAGQILLCCVCACVFI